MQLGVIYNLGIQENISGSFNTINQRISAVTQSIGSTKKAVQELAAASFGLNQLKQAFDNLGSGLNAILQPGISLNSSLSDLSALTGIAGKGLKEIAFNARSSAKAFGIEAAGAVESYKLILSQLGPDIAKDSMALKVMGEHVALLSKTMGGDAAAATEVLTTAMNQYGIDTTDAMEASRKMGEMMNVMSAGAKEGSAELPQIKAALQQAGMMAASAGVSFEELNAAIQILDKSGKKGAEGGVAIRNVLGELGKGRFQVQEVKEELQAYGIDVEQLSNKKLTLAARLRMLVPLQKDNALLTKMFGQANAAAALAMLSNVEGMSTLTQQITGTNTAVDQANVVMGSYRERMARISQLFNDIKISIFNATQSFMPFVQAVGSGVTELGMFAGGLFNVYRAMTQLPWKAMITGIKSWNVWTRISSVGTMIWGAITRGTIFTGIIPALRALGVAIMNIPIVGWIAAIIAGLIALGTYLWDSWKPFRAMLIGLWSAVKALFHNIGVVITRVWEHIVKPIFNVWWGAVKMVFSIYKAVFMGIYKVIKWVVGMVKDIFVGLWDGIVAGAKWLWNILSSVFGGVGGFFTEYIIRPIKSVFEWVWDFVSGIFNKIKALLGFIFKPIMDLWNKLFSKEGTVSVKGAYEEGKAQGEKDFDAAHKKAGTGMGIGISDLPVAGIGNKDNTKIKQSGTGQVLEKSANTSGGSGIKNITINVQDLIKEVNFNQQNLKQSADTLKRMIIEVLNGALNDANQAL